MHVRSYKFTSCKEVGHNILTCQRAPVAKNGKRNQVANEEGGNEEVGGIEGAGGGGNVGKIFRARRKGTESIEDAAGNLGGNAAAVNAIAGNAGTATVGGDGTGTATQKHSRRKMKPKRKVQVRVSEAAADGGNEVAAVTSGWSEAQHVISTPVIIEGSRKATRLAGGTLCSGGK